ncbi:MAG: hypothetical protein U5K37_00620 [Natrialbaceae archaeon]|nr:hypothetical protein [Natrialbaceae archaeon]
MAAHSRRKLLGVSLALTAGLAGCLGEPSEGPESTDNESDQPADTPGDRPGAGNETTEGATRYQASRETASWPRCSQFVHSQPTEAPMADLHVTQSSAEQWLSELPADTRPDMADTLEDVNFDESVVVSLTGQGPTLCYELAVLECRAPGRPTVRRNCRSRQRSSIPQKKVMCAQQVITVGALIVVTFDEEPVQRLSTSITDANGNVHGSAVAYESVSEAPQSE